MVELKTVQLDSTRRACPDAHSCRWTTCHSSRIYTLDNYAHIWSQDAPHKIHIRTLLRIMAIEMSRRSLVLDTMIKTMMVDKISTLFKDGWEIGWLTSAVRKDTSFIRPYTHVDKALSRWSWLSWCRPGISWNKLTYRNDVNDLKLLRNSSTSF